MEEVDLRTVLRMLRAQRWIVLGVPAVAVVAAVLLTLLVIKREYVAGSTIVYSESGIGSTAGALAGSLGLSLGLGSSAGPAAWYETVLTSTRLARKMVIKYDLVKVLGAQDDKDAIKKLLDRIVVTPKPEAQALQLQVSIPGTPKRMVGRPLDADRAALAAQVTNDLIAELGDWLATTEYSTATGQRKYVEAQLARVLAETNRTREELLATFRRSGVFAPDQQGQAWLTALAAVEAELAATRADLAGADVVKRAASSKQATLKLASNLQPDAPSSRALDALRAQEAQLEVQLRRETEVSHKTEEHPDVAGLRKALDDTRAKIALELEVSREAKRLQEKTLSTRLAQGQERWTRLGTMLNRLPAEGLVVDELRQELAGSTELLTLLTKQLILASIEEQRHAEHFTILDAAEPPRKAASPSLALAAVVGAALGLLLGVTIAAARHFAGGAAA